MPERAQHFRRPRFRGQSLGLGLALFLSSACAPHYHGPYGMPGTNPEADPRSGSQAGTDEHPVPAQQATDPQRTSPGQPRGSAGSNKATGKPGQGIALQRRQHEIKVDGRRVRYQTEAGTLDLKDEAGKVSARVFHISYTRTDVKPGSERPVTFVFNGGPGSSSVWLHLGILGPRRVVFEDAVAPTPPPYELVDNPLGLIDVSDLVFIDPVGTGYSEAVPMERSGKHTGVEADLASVGEFIRRWVTTHGRWNAPKFLAGESYGTTRAAGLVDRLQQQGMSFNGVMLISAVLDFQTIDFGPHNDSGHALILPSYAAVAAYHGAIADVPATGDAFVHFLDEVRQFASTEYAEALAAGSSLSLAQRHTIIEQLARYTGLDPAYIDAANLRIPQMRFSKQLLRARKQTVGRLDGRYLGLEADAAGSEIEHDPSYAAIVGPYTAAMNRYLYEELNIQSDKEYKILNGQVNGSWTWDRNGRMGYTNVASRLARSMRQNPHLQVFVANGYHDLATPFFATETTLQRLEIPDALRKNLHVRYYEAGHMMYVHRESLIALSRDLHRMVAQSLK